MSATRYLLICVLVGLLGCEQKTPDAPPAGAASSSSAAVGSASTPGAPVCGAAPTGKLMAERLHTANSTRTEAGLYEGPVWIKDALYFSDFTLGEGFPSRIQRFDSSSVLSTFLDDSGSNGLAVDAQGTLVAGTHKYKSVSRYNLHTLERTSVSDQYDNNVFNSPNDLVIAKDGTVYFTDPAFQREAAAGGQDKTRVYRVATDGTVSVVDDTLINPNGITLSPGGDVLYVNGNGEQGVLRAYSIVEGVPQAGSDLVTGLVHADGMTVDCHGNIYVTEHGLRRVRVFSPSGTQLAVIRADANVTNVAFGGMRGTTLFITGAGALWKVELDVTGSAY